MPTKAGAWARLGWSWSPGPCLVLPVPGRVPVLRSPPRSSTELDVGNPGVPQCLHPGLALLCKHPACRRRSHLVSALTWNHTRCLAFSLALFLLTSSLFFHTMSFSLAALFSFSGLPRGLLPITNETESFLHFPKCNRRLECLTS